LRSTKRTISAEGKTALDSGKAEEETKCEYFITTDIRLTNKKIERIKVINPIDFVRETEDLL
jgi:hypothetical protein